MTKAKIILGAVTTAITVCSAFAFKTDGKIPGNKRLLTKPAGANCRLANCWTVANTGGGYGCAAGIKFYTAKTAAGHQCTHTYTRTMTAVG